MILSYNDFQNKFYNYVFKCWSSDEISNLNILTDIRFPNIQTEHLPEKDRFWIRPNIYTVSDGQKSLSDCVGEQNGRRYLVEGFAIIQLFVPKTHLNAAMICGQVAQILKNNFRRNNEPDIWFRNCVINELEPENLWLRYNITVEFQYDEFY